MIPGELRGALLGLDEDEGANSLLSTGNSIYHSLQTSLQRRFSRGVMFNVNYTSSKSIDTFSDEGLFQIEHDQTRPELNRGPSDFHRKHRLILSWIWELPFTGNRWVEGWQLAGVGTFQSGRPFTIVDQDFSAILFSSTAPRPNLAPGATLEDQTTSGPIGSRIDAYLNRDAFVSSGVEWGNLGRNTVIGPGQRRVDVSLSKITRLVEPNVDRVPDRGLQHHQHAVLPESRERFELRRFRRDHANPRRAARVPARGETPVLNDRRPGQHSLPNIQG